MYSTADDIIPFFTKEKAIRLLGLAENISDNDFKIVVNGYIAASDLEINSVLGGAGYIVPITGAQSLMIVKGFSVGLTLGVLYLPNTDGNLPERIRTKMERAQQMIDLYGGTQGQSPLKVLPDAPSNTDMKMVSPNKAIDYSKIV